ncbi:hypothetical protein [Paenibacillus sp. HJGM_3]|uniref:hypothetical protein n=1 Tax=Paenibacillus sp. HJGM_3 TaxID=3379816 RepID=UPI0038591BCC
MKLLGKQKSLMAIILSLVMTFSLMGFAGAETSGQHPAASNGQSFELDAYALRGPQDSSAKLYLTVLPPVAQIAAPDQLKQVQVKVIGTNEQLQSTKNSKDVSSPNGSAVIDLGDVPLQTQISVQVLVQTAQTGNTEVLTAETAVTEFAINAHQTVVSDFQGYGSQMNAHLYTAINTQGTNNVPPEDVANNLESKVASLRPGLSRIFITKEDFLPGNSSQLESFYNTVQLAQKIGANVNITWQSAPKPIPDTPAQLDADIQSRMQNFANTLVDLIKNKGITVIKQITIQNEPNTPGTWISQNIPVNERYYRTLDQLLTDAGIRDQIQFVGGDLIADNQAAWFNYMADHMGDLLDGWSVHIYWDYWDTAKLQSRLTGIKAIYNTIAPEKRKPLFVTEYGVRGYKTYGDGSKINDPNPYQSGALKQTLAGYYKNSDGSYTPISETNISAFEQAWFNMLGANLGFGGFSKWDMYRAQYDMGYQDYSLIGYVFNPEPGQDRWPLRPAYYMEWLFGNATSVGWQVLGYNGTSGAKLITPYKGPNSELTLFALSTDQAAASFSIGDLPANTNFNVIIWNADGSGQLSNAGNVNSGNTGTVSVNAPAGSLVCLTTVSLPELP